MPKVKLTSALKRFFPSLTDSTLSAGTVREVIATLDKQYPGISNYLVDDNGHLRKHINVFVKGQLIADRKNLSDAVDEKDEVVIFQALSGG